MPTTRSVSQIIFNHLPGSLIYDDSQGLLGRITKVDGNTDSSIDANILAEKVRSAIERWRQGENGEEGGVNPPLEFVQPSDIECIKPESVEWELFPFYFRCRKPNCGVWHYRDELTRNHGRCKRCNSPVEQTPFVWVHHCGYLTPLAPGARNQCGRHKGQSLYLYDTGTFTTSSWRCRDCGHQTYVGFLECPQCRSTNPSPQPMKWNDPGVFSSVTFQMLNFRQEDRVRLYSAPQLWSALDGMVAGRIPPGIGAVKSSGDVSGRNCPHCGTSNLASAKFCNECGFQLPSDQERIIDADGDRFQPPLRDDLITYALLWDLPGTASLAHQGLIDSHKATQIADIFYLEKLPISLVGLGYRRQRSKRPATLCLFQPANRTKTLRIFTNSTDVEACGIRLKGSAVLAWLVMNGFVNEERAEIGRSEIECLARIEELSLEDSRIQRLVLGLLHTISHAYIIGLSWCSGMDLPSFGEELLPHALTSIVHAGDTSLGGLSSVFSQAPLQPLNLATEDLVACQLDPSCSEDDGGACVACIHLPLGCSMWNSMLSRAYLFGGETKEKDVIKVGFMQE